MHSPLAYHIPRSCFRSPLNHFVSQVASEGLRTVTCMVAVMRPHLEQEVPAHLHGAIMKLHEAAFKRFSAVDIDQEIKEKAILCMAQIVYTLADLLAEHVPACLPIFLSRLQNEITRITATKAIARGSIQALQRGGH